MISPTTASNLKTMLICHPRPISADDLEVRSLTRMLLNDPPMVRLVSGFRSRRGIYPTSPHYTLTDYGIEVAAQVCGEKLPYLRSKGA